MKLDVKDIFAKLQPLIAFIKRYVKFTFFIGMLFIIIFLVYRINQLSRLEPSEDAVTEKLQAVQRPKLDASVLEKIQELEDQNVEAKALFDQARDNPFAE